MPSVADWNRARARLKLAFARAGITTCELHEPSCWRDNALSFGHSKRRRNIPRGSGLLYEVILCCQICHRELDAHGEVNMTEIVRRTIAGRDSAVVLE